MFLDYWRIIPYYKIHGLNDRSKGFLYFKFINLIIFMISVEKNMLLIIKCTRTITPFSKT